MLAKKRSEHCSGCKFDWDHNPLVYRLIELALILLVATATVERAFSAMIIIKTDLSNKMSDELLNYWMVCYIK